MRWSVPLITSVAALGLSGCLLSTEQCGPEFVSEDGRCRPAKAPPPYYANDGADAGGGRDAARPRPDRGAPPDAGPSPALPPPEGYGAYSWVRVVDTTPANLAQARPASPGADLDAVLVIGPGNEYGFGVAVVRDESFDPTGRRRAGDPAAALGEPDATDDGDLGRFLSLGGAGGAVVLRLPFAVFSGVILEVHEAPGAVADTYRLEICPADAPLARCLPVGEGGPGVAAFTLP